VISSLNTCRSFGQWQIAFATAIGLRSRNYLPLTLAIERRLTAPAMTGCAIHRHARKLTVEQHELLELLGQLKLAGMRGQ
jgi:hypothetical protein